MKSKSWGYAALRVVRRSRGWNTVVEGLNAGASFCSSVDQTVDAALPWYPLSRRCHHEQRAHAVRAASPSHSRTKVTLRHEDKARPFARQQRDPPNFW